MDIIIRYKEKEMEINDNWAYVEMFGNVRYCKVVKTPKAKSLDKEYCFTKSHHLRLHTPRAGVKDKKVGVGGIILTTRSLWLFLEMAGVIFLSVD